MLRRFKAASDPGRSVIYTTAFRQSEQQAACTECLLLLGVIVVFIIIEARVQVPEVAGESLPDLVLVLSSEWTELGVCRVCSR